jgi:hypothetical protein
MKLKFFYSITLIAFLSSCGDTQQLDDNSSEENPTEEKSTGKEIKEAKKTIVMDSEEWVKIAVSSSGFSFKLYVPNEKVAHEKSEVIYHEESGELEILAGEMFDLILIEDAFRMEDMKAEINGHPFYKVEMILENDSSLIYRYYTEGGTKESWHIYAERSVNGSRFLIQSNKDKEFNEYETRKMLESTLTILPY